MNSTTNTPSIKKIRMGYQVTDLDAVNWGQWVQVGEDMPYNTPAEKAAAKAAIKACGLDSAPIYRQDGDDWFEDGPCFV